MAHGAQHGVGPGEALIEKSVLSYLARGQAASAKTRASGRKPTAALISEPPPSPQPIRTWISAAEPEVKETRAAAAPHFAADDLKLAAKLWQARRKLPGQEFAAALDDADAQAGAR